MQMKKTTPITAIVLDTRYEKENSATYPVRLRITCQRKQKYYPTGYDLTKSEWKKMKGNRPDQLKQTDLELGEIETRAKRIIEKMPSFSFDAFKKKFQNNHDNATVEGAFKKYISQLDGPQVGTIRNYGFACGSLLKYKKGLTLHDINEDFLKKYKKWMLDQGNSISTVGIYLRALRAVYNQVIADGDIPAELYPFGKGKHKISTARKAKKALTIAQVGAIVNYPATGTTERMRDYWYFMYLCNGINAKDMCLLKYENIQGRFLIINRAKTINTETQIENIRIALHEPAIKIIEKYGRKDAKPEDYIFPILNIGDSPEDIQNKKDLTISLINDHMEIISTDLKLGVKVTTGYARGSFATVLKRSGKSIEFISESLGHSNTDVTRHYLETFEDDTLHDNTAVIIPGQPQPAKVVSI
jgi:integrase/recombinase XerD